MDFWTVTRTVLEKNPGMKAKLLLMELEKRTELSRSTVYSHLESLVIKEEIFREKGRYYLPRHWQGHTSSQSTKGYGRPKVAFEITQMIYDVQNRCYLPPHFRVPFPRVGFNIFNRNDYPIRVRIEVRMILGGRNLGLIQDAKGYYSGKTELGFEPEPDGLANGSFSVSEECAKSDEELTLEVRVTVIDPDNREHKLLPKSWTYIREKAEWYYEPKAFTEG
jgi:hypothetical protein